ncbi:hypothetical protein GCM10010289_11480 [Streptomyces violascens]|uniref:DUF1524 domain-containing protein n=1 Tax=Streptomyces violascens TaxID=67381 RepID=A0ABQ3QKL3_9ACTN|nr:hypothetical protein GCM10010289_11480 [Streptomyces violascens]GHI37803.1 hypothetical protein Sviol_22110 [Streptomyces violascens]
MALPVRRRHLDRPLRRGHRPHRAARRGLALGREQLDHPQRQGFANGLTRPQLIAVTDHVNQAKGDKDPAKWLPSQTSYRCTYARMWVDVEHYYRLTVDSAEKSALQGILDNC